MKQKRQELRAQLLAETKERIHLLAELTFRQPSQVIDWAIAELYAKEIQAIKPVAQAVEPVTSSQKEV